MRYLIVSDIHSNLEALQAVLREAESQYERVICCGDLVGYGADPNAVLDWARVSLAAVVRGNHDKAGAGGNELEWFNPIARASATWTQQVLTEENLAWLTGLPKGPAHVEGFQILHGSPLDEDEYLINTYDVTHISPYLEAQVSFFGHTHLQGGFLCHRRGIKRIERVPDEEDEVVLELDPDLYYLINPGSVGQPRDNDPRAAWLLYSPEERLVRYRRTAYDVERAQEKIRREGLPHGLAERLGVGR